VIQCDTFSTHLFIFPLLSWSFTEVWGLLTCLFFTVIYRLATHQFSSTAGPGRHRDLVQKERPVHYHSRVCCWSVLLGSSSFSRLAAGNRSGACRQHCTSSASLVTYQQHLLHAHTHTHTHLLFLWILGWAHHWLLEPRSLGLTALRGSVLYLAQRGVASFAALSFGELLWWLRCSGLEASHSIARRARQVGRMACL
jgi:hypothetical protein